MSYNFKISAKTDDEYNYNYQINKKTILNYNKETYLNVFNKDGRKIICYGYCFDSKNPYLSQQDTLQNLLENNQVEKDLIQLNGHFILLYCENDKLTLYTDASSITPVYFSKESRIVCNIVKDTKDYIVLNPNYKLDISTYIVSRFFAYNDYDDLSTEMLENEFVTLLRNQYKYFEDKNLNIIFQADNYHKSLFAILGPTLVNKNILVKKIDSKGFNIKFGEIFSNEFTMNYFESQEGENEYPLTDGINILSRNNLSNYNAIYSKRNSGLENTLLETVYESQSENQRKFNFELNLIDNYRISNNDYSEHFLIYEPLNVRELLNILMNLNKRDDFNANLFIISTFKPSLNFYNFTSGNTLREVNLDLKQENMELKGNSISSRNQKFLVNVKLSNFSVSQNLDGKLKKDEILIYPARQKVKKGTSYKLEYKGDFEGLVYIEGFYKNKNNARRIIVKINGENFNIFDFYGGRYFYMDGSMDIEIKYTQDYDSLSWQKASTLRVKVIK